jgi:carbamoyl-phosphate synthase large subunit
VARVLIGGAGGAASNGFARSLRASERGDHLIGTNASATDLLLAPVDERHVVPDARSDEYDNALFSLLNGLRPDVIHVQPDAEVVRVSALRHMVKAAGTRYLLPDHAAVLLCQDKWSSYERWRDAAVPVPETRLLEAAEDLELAFRELGPELWLRKRSGAGGAGSLRTRSAELARAWVDSRHGWGRFTAAECLTSDTVTWQSIWHQGELVVAQTRRRWGWAYGANAPTGVSGITAVGETWSSEAVDRTAEAAIRAVSERPHGLYGVDMTFDHDGVARLTEINIGRFFTTHEFFTRAGLNMPELFVTLALEGTSPNLERRVNPLPNGLLWVRGMDVEPVLTTAEELERLPVVVQVHAVGPSSS